MSTFQYRLRAPSGPISVEDYRAAARRRIPAMAWAYLDGAAEDGITRDANRRAFERLSFVPRVLRGFATTDLSTEVAGSELSLPVLLAPTGLSGLAHWSGELGLAQGAERAGTVAILSTASTYTIEEVAAGTASTHLFQLYPWTDVATSGREVTRSLIERAARAGYGALVVTVDSPTMGNREGERRHGMGLPPVLTPQRIVNARGGATALCAIAGFRRATSSTPAARARVSPRCSSSTASCAPS
jgi:L-lactate dehydrogenase (cytochrome)/(S)-mandelate dehydrogenase